MSTCGPNSAHDLAVSTSHQAFHNTVMCWTQAQLCRDTQSSAPIPAEGRAALGRSSESPFSWLQGAMQTVTFFFPLGPEILLYLTSLLSKAQVKRNISYKITVETNLERFLFCKLAWSWTVFLWAIIKFRFRLKPYKHEEKRNHS